MNFSETYRRMNEPVGPSPDLIRKTLAPARRRRFPRRLIAIAVAAAVLLATPALAVRSEMGYYVLYQISPAVAQLFQPVRMSCTDSGVTMEVAAVRVEGDTAQAYITLSGGPVDAATDLFDSYSFHLPFDQSIVSVSPGTRPPARSPSSAPYRPWTAPPSPPAAR